MPRERKLAVAASGLCISLATAIFIICRQIPFTAAIKDGGECIGVMVFFVIIDICFFVIALRAWYADIYGVVKIRRCKAKIKKTEAQLKMADRHHDKF